MTGPPAKQWIGTIGQHPSVVGIDAREEFQVTVPRGQIAGGRANASDPLQVGVLEGRGVLQTEAEHAIHAEMCRPNESIRQELGMNTACRNGHKE